MLSPTRFLLFAGFFVFLSPFSANGTEEFANPPTPLPAKVVEQIATNLVNLIFLFDRVASDPPTATTPDYLERISKPSSPFYGDYLDYRRGSIDRIMEKKALKSIRGNPGSSPSADRSPLD